MSALVPRGAWVDEVSAIRGSAGHPREVAVVWRTGPPHARTYGAFSPSDGLAVWRADGRDRYGRVVWRLLYSVSHRAGALHRWVGQPGDVHRTWLLAGLSLATRDVTGDGRREVILVEGPTGSGGCTRWRVLGSTGESVDLLFDRDYCDTEVRLRPAALVVRASVYHRGCSIHGCPGLRRVTRFVWDGDSFEPGPSVVVRD
jgi:hypothetical protein